MSEHEGNPKTRKFTLQESKLLIEGKFWEDELEDEDFIEKADDAILKQAAAKANKAIYINRDNLDNGDEAGVVRRSYSNCCEDWSH